LDNHTLIRLYPIRFRPIPIIVNQSNANPISIVSYPKASTRYPKTPCLVQNAVHPELEQNQKTKKREEPEEPEETPQTIITT
jgi:hypothetical protein